MFFVVDGTCKLTRQVVSILQLRPSTAVNNLQMVSNMPTESSVSVVPQQSGEAFQRALTKWCEPGRNVTLDVVRMLSLTVELIG